VQEILLRIVHSTFASEIDGSMNMSTMLYHYDYAAVPSRHSCVN